MSMLQQVLLSSWHNLFFWTSWLKQKCWPVHWEGGLVQISVRILTIQSEVPIVPFHCSVLSNCLMYHELIQQMSLNTPQISKQYTRQSLFYYGYTRQLTATCYLSIKWYALSITHLTCCPSFSSNCNMPRHLRQLCCLVEKAEWAHIIMTLGEHIRTET